MNNGIISDVLNNTEFSMVISKIRDTFLSPYTLWMISTIVIVVLLQLVSIMLLILLLRQSKYS